MKALIVDDHLLNRKLLEKLLVDYAECDLVENGKIAFDNFKQAIEQKAPYDLICLDIMMPEMDGFEALKQIKEYNDVSSKKVKVIMCTALKDTESVAKSVSLGCDGYLGKPYNRQKLEKQLRKLKLID